MVDFGAGGEDHLLIKVILKQKRFALTYMALNKLFNSSAGLR